MGALIGGIIFVLLGLWGLVTWWQLFLKGLMAALPFMFFIGGIIAIAAGISDIKDRMEEQKEKAREKKEEPKQDAGKQ